MKIGKIIYSILISSLVFTLIYVSILGEFSAEVFTDSFILSTNTLIAKNNLIYSDNNSMYIFNYIHSIWNYILYGSLLVAIIGKVEK